MGSTLLRRRLNAPTGAWYSLTASRGGVGASLIASQCTYRCVVLPDPLAGTVESTRRSMSQCTYRCVVLPAIEGRSFTRIPGRLNAPTGAWYSLPSRNRRPGGNADQVSMHLQVRGTPCLRPKVAVALVYRASQCTYRCVVLPAVTTEPWMRSVTVSMHLQVRGTPCPLPPRAAV